MLYCLVPSKTFLEASPVTEPMPLTTPMHTATCFATPMYFRSVPSRIDNAAAVRSNKTGGNKRLGVYTLNMTTQSTERTPSAPTTTTAHTYFLVVTRRQNARQYIGTVVKNGTEDGDTCPCTPTARPQQRVFIVAFRVQGSPTPACLTDLTTLLPQQIYTIDILHRSAGHQGLAVGGLKRGCNPPFARGRRPPTSFTISSHAQTRDSKPDKNEN